MPHSTQGPEKPLPEPVPPKLTPDTTSDKAGIVALCTASGGAIGFVLLGLMAMLDVSSEQPGLRIAWGNGDFAMLCQLLGGVGGAIAGLVFGLIRANGAHRNR